MSQQPSRSGPVPGSYGQGGVRLEKKMVYRIDDETMKMLVRYMDTNKLDDFNEAIKELIKNENS